MSRDIIMTSALLILVPKAPDSVANSLQVAEQLAVQGFLFSVASLKDQLYRALRVRGPQIRHVN